MSQAEMEQMDRDVMNIVNEHANPKAAAAADEIAAAFAEQEARAEEAKNREKQEKVKRLINHQKRKDAFSAIAWVAVCLMAIAALLLAIYVPGALIWVVNVGILTCGIVAALKIDKYIRWWR